eukprot:jgi/Chlat1/499/Chrsp103S00986
MQPGRDTRHDQGDDQLEDRRWRNSRKTTPSTSMDAAALRAALEAGSWASKDEASSRNSTPRGSEVSSSWDDGGSAVTSVALYRAISEKNSLASKVQALEQRLRQMEQSPNPFADGNSHHSLRPDASWPPEGQMRHSMSDMASFLPKDNLRPNSFQNLFDDNARLRATNLELQHKVMEQESLVDKLTADNTRLNNNITALEAAMRQESADAAQELDLARRQFAAQFDEECERRAKVEEAGLMRIGELEAQLQQMRDGAASYEKQLADLRSQLSGTSKLLQAERGAAAADRDRLLAQVDSLEKRIKQLMAENALAKADAENELEQTIEQLESAAKIQVSKAVAEGEHNVVQARAEAATVMANQLAEAQQLLEAAVAEKEQELQRAVAAKCEELKQLQAAMDKVFAEQAAAHQQQLDAQQAAMDKLNGEIDSLDQKLAAAVAEREQLVQLQHALEDERNELQHQLLALQQQLDKQQCKTAEVTAERDELSRKSQEQKAKVAELQARLGTLAQEGSDTAKHMASAVSSLQRRVEELEGQSNALIKAKADAEATSREREAELQNKEAELQKFTSELDELRAQAANLEHSEQDLITEKLKLTGQVQDAQSRLAECLAQIAGLETKVEALSSEKHSLSEQLRSTQETSIALESEVAEARSTERQLSQQNAELAGEAESLRSQVLNNQPLGTRLQVNSNTHLAEERNSDATVNQLETALKHTMLELQHFHQAMAEREALDTAVHEKLQQADVVKASLEARVQELTEQLQQASTSSRAVSDNLRDTAAADSSKLSQEVETAQAGCRELERTVKALQASSHNYLSQAEQHKKAAAQHEATIAQLQSSMAKLKEELRQSAQERNTVETNITGLALQYAEVCSKMEALEQQCKDAAVTRTMEEKEHSQLLTAKDTVLRELLQFLGDVVDAVNTEVRRTAMTVMKLSPSQPHPGSKLLEWGLDKYAEPTEAQQALVRWRDGVAAALAIMESKIQALGVMLEDAEADRELLYELKSERDARKQVTNRTAELELDSPSAQVRSHFVGNGHSGLSSPAGSPLVQAPPSVIALQKKIDDLTQQLGLSNDGKQAAVAQLLEEQHKHQTALGRMEEQLTAAKAAYDELQSRKVMSNRDTSDASLSLAVQLKVAQDLNMALQSQVEDKQRLIAVYEIELEAARDEVEQAQRAASHELQQAHDALQTAQDRLLASQLEVVTAKTSLNDVVQRLRRSEATIVVLQQEIAALQAAEVRAKDALAAQQQLDFFLNRQLRDIEVEAEQNAAQLQKEQQARAAVERRLIIVQKELELFRASKR